MNHRFLLGDIARFLGAELLGDQRAVITGLNTLQKAGSGELAFLANPKYAKYLEKSDAEAVILAADQADSFSGNRLVMTNPYLGYARISQWFEPRSLPTPGIHPTAVVHESAEFGDAVSVGPFCVIDEGVRLGAGVELGAGVVVGARSVIGAGSRISANASIYHDVDIGARVVIHSGTVIGADGFGFAPNRDGSWVKIHQIGGVRIGDDVEIGACTTIDRGALGDTVIGDCVILDNHIQIAHNVEVGDYTAIAGCTAIAGSTKIGRNCLLAGRVSISGHLTICDNVQLTAGTLVTGSIEKPGSYSSGTPVMETREWRKNAVRASQLDKMARQIRQISKQ